MPILVRGRSLPSLVEAAGAGDVLALGRLLSYAESPGADLGALLRALAALPPRRGSARVLGITGPPGAGKSTLTSVLVAALRDGGGPADRGNHVAVLAVDPSSARSGGALLGDRIRMQRHDLDPTVAIRSLGSRGQLGGLSGAVPIAVRVLEAVGFGTVLVETVGVGQSEIGVVALADTTLVVLAPGMGDGVQAEKAGLLEEADVFVVNKVDRPDAARLRRDLRATLRLTHPDEGAWTAPIVGTDALAGTGLPDLVDAIDRHREWAQSHGAQRPRLRGRVAEEIRAVAAAERLRAWADRDRDPGVAARLAEQVLDGELDVVDAATRLL
ncbi:methylmalonyl Co-A mutase-associated GTPase MeaB [Patulibacter sp. S7RM1-6]